MDKNNVFKLADETIAQIAKLVQMAIISGTDVVDHLRLMSLYESNTDDGKLVLTEDYRKLSEGHVEKMLQELEDVETYQN